MEYDESVIPFPEPKCVEKNFFETHLEVFDY